MKSSKIIDKRNSISREITNYWKIIKVENIVEANYKRNYDLKKIYDEIIIDSKRRVHYKLILQCINMGLHSLKELPIDNNYKNVFILSELEERKVKLSTIKTLNPDKKKKLNKKTIKLKEALTQNWVNARLRETDLQIIKYKSLIENFNNNIEFDDSEIEMNSEMKLAA